jgi:hypothetical protein
MTIADFKERKAELENSLKLNRSRIMRRARAIYFGAYFFGTWSEALKQSWAERKSFLNGELGQDAKREVMRIEDLLLNWLTPAKENTYIKDLMADMEIACVAGTNLNSWN